MALAKRYAPKIPLHVSTQFGVINSETARMLRDLGANFDIASRYELDRALSLDISPDRISYGNTIKKAADIQYFYEKGVRLFATDSEGDVRNLAKFAPGARVFFRILCEGG